MLDVVPGARGSFLRLLTAALALALAELVVQGSAASAATRYVAPAGSGGACTSAAPCRDFDAAYAAAAPGDVVEVAGGSYPSQTITAANKAGGPQVQFRPAPGAGVTVGDVDVWRSHVGLADMTVGDVTVRKQDVSSPPAVGDVTLTRLSGRNFNIFDATDVQILGGEWGPASACGGPHGGGNNSLRRIAGTVPTHILIDGVAVHDVQSYDLNACHTEGLAIFAGSDVTVRNSKFYGNSIYDIFVQDNSGPIDTITLENNWFAAPVGTTGQVNGTTVAFSTVPQNVAIRQNSFNAQMSLDDNGTNPTYVGWVIERNVGPLPYGACSLKGIVFRSNAWTNGACGSTDVNLNGPAPYVNPSNDASADYHLTGGPAVALGAGGNPSSGGVGGSPTAGNPAGGPAAAGPVGGGAVRRKAPRKASLAASKRSINVSRRGSFSFGFRASAGLRGRVAFKRATKVRVGATRKTVTLVRKSYTVPSSTKVKLAFKLSRRNLRILRTKRKLKTTVVVTLTNAAGLSSTARATIMLKR